MKNCIQSSVSQFKRLLGVKPPREGDLEGIPVLTHPMCKELPKELDARNAWHQCSTIGRILDQGHCGSCWAFGAVESLSDCFCIHYGLNNSEDLYSPFMILACPAMVQLGMVEQVNTEAI